MKTCRLFFLSLILFLAGIPCWSQNISGVVNHYAAVKTLNGETITVDKTDNFLEGDKVLLIQMKGAEITTGNTQNFGTITNYGNAGNFEFLTIEKVSGNKITTTNAPCKKYNVSGAVQLVRVPVFENAVVAQSVICPAWNGATGGVIVIETSGVLTLKSAINASGKGFRGGSPVSGYFVCGDGEYASGDLGKKGEAIAVVSSQYDGGRAALANGGGGSNRGNPGAGGGGNYGAGGHGGNEWSGCGESNIYGKGGNALSIASGKIFMGGGGGGGFQDNNNPVSPGANGGGIIMIKASSIEGNGNAIRTNGANVSVLADYEGCGGGGGGGAAYFWVENYVGSLKIEVNGGNGGNVKNTLEQNECHGPGGGGGGGYVWFSQSETPSNVNVFSSGGKPGMVLNSGPCLNTSNDATKGANGTTLYDLLLPGSSEPSVDLGDDFNIQEGDKVELKANYSYSSYLWSNGDKNSSTIVDQPGKYWLEVPIGCENTDRDTVEVFMGAFIRDTVSKKTEVVFTENNVPVSIKERDVELQNTIVVNQPEFDIEVWDQSMVDGDSISLNLNGNWILQEYVVVKTKLKIHIKIDPNFSNNYLILYAHNLGEFSPNTAAVQVLIGDQKYKLQLSSDLSKSGALNFSYEPQR